MSDMFFENISLIEFILIAIATFFMAIVICNSRFIELKGMIVIAMLLRIGLMICDLEHWFSIPNLGTDSEAFHIYAIKNQTLTKDVHLTNYTVLLTFIYKLTDCSRAAAQMLNVMLGVGVIILGQGCLQLLKVGRRALIVGSLILCFSPNLIIFSAGLLREAWCEFFITLSLYFFVKWFVCGGKNRFFILAISLVLAAAYMHSGSIGVLVGYLVVFTLYDKNRREIRLGLKSLVGVGVFVVLAAFVINNMEFFGAKFQSLESNTASNVLIERYNSHRGGRSDYLVGLDVKNVWDVIMYAPLKILYFLFSPVPWEWTDLKDVVAFIIDSSIYLCICIMILFRRNDKRSVLKHGLLISLLTMTFIFALGVTNCGTAMRHRAKFMPLFVVTLCISLTPDAVYRRRAKNAILKTDTDKSRTISRPRVHYLIVSKKAGGQRAINNSHNPSIKYSPTLPKAFTEKEYPDYEIKEVLK